MTDPDAVLGISANLAVMRALDGEIKTLERIARGRPVPDAAFQALLTVNGIGDILGMTIRLETGEIGRFAGPGNYASYSLGCGAMIGTWPRLRLWALISAAS